MTAENRYLHLMLFVIAIIAGLALVSMAHANATAGVLADDAIYLLMASWFSGALGMDVSDTSFVWQHSQFPPVYPIVLGLLGGNADNVQYAHALTATMTVIGAMTAFGWMRANRSISSLTCLVVAVWWMLMPKTVYASIEAMSEPLYVILSFAAMWMYERSRMSGVGMVVAAGCVLLAALCRSTGITLAVAFLYCTWRVVDWRRFSIMAICIVVPLLSWNVVSSRIFGAGRVYIGEPAQYFSHSSVSAQLLRLFVEWPQSFWAAWLGQFSVINIPAVTVLCALVLALSLVGLVRRLADHRLDAVYVILYVGLIWLWPYPDHIHRFIWPLMPVLLFYSADALARLACRVPVPVPTLRIGLLVIALAIALPNWAILVHRYLRVLPPDLTDYRGSRFNLRTDSSAEASANIMLFRRVTEALAAAGATIPKGECVTASNRDLMMFFGRRPSVFPPLPAVTDDEFEASMDCRFLYVQRLMSNPYLPDGYPLARVRQKTMLRRFVLQSDTGPLEIGALYEVGGVK